MEFVTTNSTTTHYHIISVYLSCMFVSVLKNKSRSTITLSVYYVYNELS